MRCALGVQEKRRIAENLLILRKRKGLRQQDLVELSGVGRAAIIRYEKGKGSDPSLASIIALANALDTTPDHILGYQDIEKI